MDDRDARQVAEQLWRALQAGDVVKETDDYAQPFQAPEWRAQWVERT